MADISLKVRADKLGKSLENLAPQIEEEINSAVRNLAHAAHSAMIKQMQESTTQDQNKQDYLKALKIKELGNDSYVIYLDSDWANKLESGYGKYSIREQLLNSKKIVGVGSRAGEPWVRKAKDGHRYAAVPFQQTQFRGKPGGSGDLGADIKNLYAQGRNNVVQKITKTFKDVDGKPLQGKVATVTGEGVPANLQGLTKYQTVSKSGKVSSIYMTYRMISDAGKDWLHPGSKGFQIFKRAQDFIEKELDNIILTVLK